MVSGENSDVSDEEILQDISDVNDEVADMCKKEKGYRIIGDRLSIMKANRLRDGIQKRKEFIENLNMILEARDDEEYECL